MFCARCGKELEPTSAFCGNCGTKNPDYNQQEAFVKKETPSKPKRKALAIAICAAAVIIIVVLISTTSPRLKLKYAWGTEIDYFLQNEIVISDGSYGGGWGYLCEDPYNEADNVEGFSSDEVMYIFDDGQLMGIRYEYDEDNSVTVRRDVATAFFGKKYYTYQNGPEQSASDYWWIGDTIVILGWDDIEFYDAEWCRQNWQSDSWDELCEFFGKT